MRGIWLCFSLFFLYGQPNKPFHPTPDRDYDVLHTRIDIKIDLTDKTVSGEVTHVLSPLSVALRTIVFDAADMDVKSVSSGSQFLRYDQLDDKLWIELDRAYGFTDTLNVTINYSASPRRGLYFIRPDSAYPNKHFQAWTQGEDMDNHYWVPLYDYPNDKTTFECVITVPKPFVAISNGELFHEKDNGDTRTFHWRENFPMSTYLISFAVGEYQMVADHYRALPIRYWVYPEHTSEDAFRSFGRTPDILTFFNRITGFEYPYEKYDQVIIEDFMYGGMENVTLTHQSDRTMHTARAQPDHSSVGLVAHELAHQWYGDLLTTRNWANAWLNEGFATFLTYLWFEHDKGTDEAEYVRLQQMRGVTRADRSRRRPMVQFYYDDSMELFDANIYAKGSVLLNMLRQILGEEPFWKAIRYYTKTNAFRNVETQDLKKAIEETTGQNLYWFFDQWVYNGGLPEFNVESKYNRRTKTVTLTVTQTQDSVADKWFRTPVTILVDQGEVTRKTVWLDGRETVITIPSERVPRMVIFDEGKIIPARLTFRKTDRELIYQLRHAPHIVDRIWAIREMSKGSGRRKIIEALLNTIAADEFWGVKVEAADALGRLKPKTIAKKLMAVSEGQDNRVKRACVRALSNYDGGKVKDFLVNILRTSDKDYLLADALRSLSKVDSTAMEEQLTWALSQDSHGDRIRKTAVSYLGDARSKEHYNRLLDLAKYGHATYDSRPAVFSALGNYMGDYPEVLNIFTDYLSDPDWEVRRNCIRQLGRYGKEEHLPLLDQRLVEDPLNEKYIADAMRKIKSRGEKKSSETRSMKAKLRELERKIDKIRGIIDD